MNKKNYLLKIKPKTFFDSLVVFSDDHQNHYLLALKLFKEKPIYIYMVQKVLEIIVEM